VGSMLRGEDIKRYLLESPPLIEGLIDASIQVQPNGVDLTVARIEAFLTRGGMGFEASARELSHTRSLGLESRKAIVLEPGCYKVAFNEVVNLPLNVVALCKTRSSLLRCGAFVETALWDAGYHGRGESLLVVLSSHGFRIERNARIAQLLFFKLDEPVSQGYSGTFQEGARR